MADNDVWSRLDPTLGLGEQRDAVATIARELRTSLNAILGFSALLGDGIYGNLSSQQVAPVARISALADHLCHLIDPLERANSVNDGWAYIRGRLGLPVEPGDVIAKVRAYGVPRDLGEYVADLFAPKQHRGRPRLSEHELRQRETRDLGIHNHVLFEWATQSGRRAMADAIARVAEAHNLSELSVRDAIQRVRRRAKQDADFAILINELVFSARADRSAALKQQRERAAEKRSARKETPQTSVKKAE